MNKALVKYPSLEPHLEATFAECYRDALEQAGAKTDLPPTLFPIKYPYIVTQVLDAQFLPKKLKTPVD